MSAQIKTKIVSIIRSDFDQTPKNWEGDGWYDNAEEVADDIIALFSSPVPAAVEELVARLGERWASTDEPVSKKIDRRLALCREAATALSTLAADKARIEAERDAAREDARKASERHASSQALEAAAKMHAEAAAARASALQEILEAVRPYLDSILCYASTVDEHDGNRVSKLVHDKLEELKNNG